MVTAGNDSRATCHPRPRPHRPLQAGASICTGFNNDGCAQRRRRHQCQSTYDSRQTARLRPQRRQPNTRTRGWLPSICPALSTAHKRQQVLAIDTQKACSTAKMTASTGAQSSPVARPCAASRLARPGSPSVAATSSLPHLASARPAAPSLRAARTAGNHPGRHDNRRDRRSHLWRIRNHQRLGYKDRTHGDRQIAMAAIWRTISLRAAIRSGHGARLHQTAARSVTITAAQQNQANLTLTVAQASQTVTVEAASSTMPLAAQLAPPRATLRVACHLPRQPSRSVFEITTDNRRALDQSGRKDLDTNGSRSTSAKIISREPASSAPPCVLRSDQAAGPLADARGEPACPPAPSSSPRLLLPFAPRSLHVAAVLSLTHTRAQQPPPPTPAGGSPSPSRTTPQRKASGKLIAEILDPEDHVLGRTERNVDITKGDGSWQQSSRPTSHPLRRHHLAAPALPLRIRRRQAARHRRHRIHLADSAPAGRPHPRPDRVPRGQRGRDPRHRLRRQQQRHR